MIAFLCFITGFACCHFLTLVSQEDNNRMRGLPSPITELSMEKSFNYAKLCQQLDACEDKEMLRKFAKQALKISMINEMNVANLVKGYATAEVSPMFLPMETEE